MWSRLTSRLYVRIWLAVVLTVAVLTAALGWAWRMSSDMPMPHREIVVRNQTGQVIAQAQNEPDHRPGQDLSFEVTTSDGQTLEIQLPRPHHSPNGSGGLWMRPPFGFGWMLALVGLAVALAAYPIIRRLTLRLEALQRGVELWGSGDLSARVTVEGRDEVAFLATRFNSAAERIQALVETQKALLNAHKNLLANASHELRSPLARIRMGLELMAPTLPAARFSLPPDGGAAPAARAATGLVDATPSDFAASNAVNAAAQHAEISRSITELDQLIDEILLASRLDAGQTDNEPMEVLDLTGLAAEECSRVNAELKAGADAGTHAGEPLTSPSVLLRGSPRLLRRLLRNLLENARRYSNGEVALALSVGGTDAAPLAIIRVSDRGPGVPAAQRERIFEPFYRLPGASEREGGVGLGLALVKSISERHGGTVRCEDNPGGGASFVVELPA